MNKPIKVIRKQERQSQRDRDENAVNSAKTENQVRREIGATVLSWIEERREPPKAFNLFKDSAGSS